MQGQSTYKPHGCCAELFESAFTHSLGGRCVPSAGTKNRRLCRQTSQLETKVHGRTIAAQTIYQIKAMVAWKLGLSGNNYAN